MSLTLINKIHPTAVKPQLFKFKMKYNGPCKHSEIANVIVIWKLNDCPVMSNCTVIYRSWLTIPVRMGGTGTVRDAKNEVMSLALCENDRLRGTRAELAWRKSRITSPDEQRSENFNNGSRALFVTIYVKSIMIPCVTNDQINVGPRLLLLISNLCAEYGGRLKGSVTVTGLIKLTSDLQRDPSIELSLIHI